MIKSRTPYVTAPRATVAMGAAGALVGGAVAAARNYDRVQKKDMTREAAVRDVIKESGTTGLATATATAVMGALGFTGLLSLAGIVFVAAGTKHLADKLLEGTSAKPTVPAVAAKQTDVAADAAPEAPEAKEAGTKAKTGATK